MRLNAAIRARELRVIDENGSQLGILSKDEALKMAEEQDLDLVGISPKASPPVAKIIDWGKYNYQRTKQQQKTKRNTKVVDIKQIRLGLKIGEHDLGVKVRKANQFLEDGHKVKFIVFFRGRENAHKDLGFKLAEKIIEDWGERVTVEQAPQLSGRQLMFVVRNNANAKAKNS